MASSGNFSVLNPLDNPLSDSSSNTPSNGNLKFTSSGNCTAVSTIGLTFKAYAEVRIESISNYGGEIGLGGGTESNVFYKDNIYFQTNYQSGKVYHYKDGTNQAGSVDIGGTVSAGDIIMMCWDPDTFKWWVGVNGTWRNSGDPANGTGFIYQYNSGSGDLWGNNQSNNNSRWSNVCSSANGLTCTWNFGQDSTFGGAVTAGGNADGNGFGDFKYTPPTGFLATCSGNMVISSDIDPGQSDNNIPQKQFGVVTWTGDGTTGRAISGLGFSPDLIWFKDRTQAFSHRIYDTSRGIASNGGKRLFSNTTAAENDQTSGQDISAVGADGFTLGASDANYTNYNTDGNVAWCWKCGGGTTSSDDSGDITVTRQTNDAAKFSILTYTGNGTDGQTVAHGLGVEPDFVIATPRNSSGSNRVVWIRGLTLNGSSSEFLKLNTTASIAQSGQIITVSSSTIGVGGNANLSSKNQLLYAWANVEGFSKFSSYVGNGNADGPFIYTGFRPRLLFIKGDNSGDWVVIDTARATVNITNTALAWNLSNADQTSNRELDIFSNGFKPMTSNSNLNTSGTKYMFGAWGDVPFKYNNTF